MASTTFRDLFTAKHIAEKIREVAPKKNVMKICHICGTHEWVITHYGLRELLPKNIEVFAGPGCPVCIVPASEIDEAVKLALKGMVVTCFGDVFRVLGSRMSLLDTKAIGADVRVVYSIKDAISMAERESDKEFVFFAVGFETTAPSTALEVIRNPPENLSFLLSHRLIPPAMRLLAELKDMNLNGFIAPGHVSTIIGLKPYEVFPQKYGIPTVVAGFEPLDILFGIYMILKQISEGKPMLENEYSRAVKPEGNIKAQQVMNKVFKVTDSNWRGLGLIPSSKFVFQNSFEKFDAHVRYGIKIDHSIDIQSGCKCNLIVLGRNKPTECSLFMKKCTPQTPVGACMVSNEGTCRIWATRSLENR